MFFLNQAAALGGWIVRWLPAYIQGATRSHLPIQKQLHLSLLYLKKNKYGVGSVEWWGWVGSNLLELQEVRGGPAWSTEPKSRPQIVRGTLGLV